MFCNVADNQYFVRARERGITFDGLTREQLVAQRRLFVERTRAGYREFWVAKVAGTQ